MSLFKNTVCPVSDRRTESYASRLTVLVCSALLVGYLVTGNVWLPAIVAIDYFIRAIGQGKYSPIRAMSAAILDLFSVKPKMVDEAPKLFASRVGFIFAALAVIFAPFSLVASFVFAGILGVFSFLDGAFNFCVGCLTYHYVVFPLMGKPNLAK